MSRALRFGGLAIVCSLVSVNANAQFKEIKAAPFSAAMARQKIRALLENVNDGNRDQTVATLSGWLQWYRDLLDTELIARWKSDGRANMSLIMGPLADARVAREVVEYSWRVDRPAAFTLANAPMLGDLMARYPDSAKPLLEDLLPPATADRPALSLTETEAEAVCRILLDMPDIGTWRETALRILPHYRSTVDRLLKQDMGGPDQERSYRAQRWRADLRLDPPPAVDSRRLVTRTDRRADTSPWVPDRSRPHIVGQVPDAATGYTGPTSGTFESDGEPIPQNGECVFRNIPPVKLLLDFDTKHWEARLAPGEGQTQVLVLRNKGRGPQKRCVVHWTVVP